MWVRYTKDANGAKHLRRFRDAMRWWIYDHLEKVSPTYGMYRLASALRSGFAVERSLIFRHHILQPRQMNPDVITYKIRGSGKDLFERHWLRRRQLMRDGNWDLNTRPYEDMAAVVQRVKHDIPWSETDHYREMVRQLESGQKPRNCTSVEEINAYFDVLEKAWNEISNGFYRTQRELGGWVDNEIGVVVDRNGKVGISPGGNHRLAMVRMVGLNVVPVVVCKIHVDWVSTMASMSDERLIEKVERGLIDIGLEPWDGSAWSKRRNDPAALVVSSATRARSDTPLPRRGNTRRT